MRFRLAAISLVIFMMLVGGCSSVQPTATGTLVPEPTSTPAPTPTVNQSGTWQFSRSTLRAVDPVLITIDSGIASLVLANETPEVKKAIETLVTRYHAFQTDDIDLFLSTCNLSRDDSSPVGSLPDEAALRAELTNRWPIAPLNAEVQNVRLEVLADSLILLSYDHVEGGVTVERKVTRFIGDRNSVVFESCFYGSGRQ